MVLAQPKITLGDLLKRARRDAGLDQAQLAEQIGRSRAVVSKWELDRSVPDFQDVKRIIEATDADWLLTEPFRTSDRTRSAWFHTIAGQQVEVVAA